MGELVQRILSFSRPETLSQSETSLKELKATWFTGSSTHFSRHILISPLTYPHLNCSFSDTFPSFDELKRGSDIKDLSLRYFQNNPQKWLQNNRIFDLLQELEILDLTGSHLSTDSNEMQILKNLFQCQKLVYCNLSKCSLYSLPPEISFLSELNELNLHQNNITEIPPELFQLQNLRKLILSGNQLTTIPDTIISLEKLVHLDLSGNPLTEFPQCTFSLQLQELFLWNTQLETLPDRLPTSDHNQFPLFNSLTNLDLHANRLNQLPQVCTRFPNLTSLDVSCNQLLALPEDLGENMKNLMVLNARGNNLVLLPPSIFKNKPQQLSLYTAQNRFCVPPDSYPGSMLDFYSGLLRGSYFDPWILDMISRCCTLQKWNDPHLLAIFHSTPADILRRHIDKLLADHAKGKLNFQ